MKYHRIISAVLLPLMFLQLTGCTKWIWIEPVDIRPEGETIRTVEMIDGQRIYLDAEPRATVDRDTLFSESGTEPVRYPLDQLNRAEAKRLNTGPIVALALVTAVLAAFVIAVGASDTSGIQLDKAAPSTIH